MQVLAMLSFEEYTGITTYETGGEYRSRQGKEQVASYKGACHIREHATLGEGQVQSVRQGGGR